MFRSSLTLTATHTSAGVHYKHRDTNYDSTTGLISFRRHCLNGGRGIRTPGAVNPAVFKTAAIVHSAIPPLPTIPQPSTDWKGCPKITNMCVYYSYRKREWLRKKMWFTNDHWPFVNHIFFLSHSLFLQRLNKSITFIQYCH